MSLPVCGRLIACDALLGAPRVPFCGYAPDVADLEAEMARLCIDTSIVRHRACLETAPYIGNDVLMAEIAGHDNLLPAWFVTPDGREPDWSPAVLVEKMIAAGALLAWLDPEAEMMSMQPWCSGELYETLQEHRLPLLLPYNKIKMDDLHLVLQAYPRLPIILFSVLRLGRNRLLEPLLEQHPQLYLCFGPTFSVHNYFRDLCNRYGPARWVWGAAYPEYEGGAGIAGLTYSGLNADEMAMVAHGNIERLLAEVIV
jgi:hypothetical protein